MSNTGKNKILATFNCDPDLWQQFKEKCRSCDSNATAVLLDLIALYLDTDIGKNLEEGTLPIKQKEMDSYINKYLDKHLYIYIDKYLEVCLEQKLQKHLDKNL